MIRDLRDRIARALLEAASKKVARAVAALRGRRGRDFIGPYLDRVDMAKLDDGRPPGPVKSPRPARENPFFALLKQVQEIP